MQGRRNYMCIHKYAPGSYVRLFPTNKKKKFADGLRFGMQKSSTYGAMGIKLVYTL